MNPMDMTQRVSETHTGCHPEAACLTSWSCDPSLGFRVQGLGSRSCLPHFLVLRSKSAHVTGVSECRIILWPGVAIFSSLSPHRTQAGYTRTHAREHIERRNAGRNEKVRISDLGAHHARHAGPAHVNVQNPRRAAALG
jgi:hypothetical protein